MTSARKRLQWLMGVPKVRGMVVPEEALVEDFIVEGDTFPVYI